MAKIQTILLVSLSVMSARAMGKINSISLVVGPIHLSEQYEQELLTKLRAVQEVAMEEGNAEEYDIYVTKSGVLLKDTPPNRFLPDCTFGDIPNKRVPQCNIVPEGPYYLRQVYPSATALKEHGKSLAFELLRFYKNVADKEKNIDGEAVADFPMPEVTRNEVISNEDFLSTQNTKGQNNMRFIEKHSSAPESVGLKSQLRRHHQ